MQKGFRLKHFLSILPFVLIMMSVLGSIVYFYLGSKLKNIPSKKVVITAKILLIIAILSPVGGIFLRYLDLPFELYSPMSWGFYTLVGLLSFVLVVSIIRDVVMGLYALYLKAFAYLKKAPIEASAMRRRDFLKLTSGQALFPTAIALSGVSIYEARKLAKVEQVGVTLPKLPLAWEGVKIAQISDLHLGNTIKRGFLETIVEKVNALEPDIIAITGDSVDGSVKQLRHHIDILGELDAPYGAYIVTGNHEYYSGAPFWLEEFERLGLRTLVNAHEVLERQGERLIIAGVNDYTAHRYIHSHLSDPVKALQGTHESDTKILLAHQPKSIFKVSQAGADLQLSGHTHGGQFFPYNYVVDYMHPYVRGLHLHEGKTWIYVNRGTGYWGIPMRLGSPSEITLLTLKQS